MKPLRNAIEDYIALRRSLGFKLHHMATGLGEFAAFLEQRFKGCWRLPSAFYLSAGFAPGLITVYSGSWPSADSVSARPSSWSGKMWI